MTIIFAPKSLSLFPHRPFNQPLLQSLRSACDTHVFISQLHVQIPIISTYKLCKLATYCMADQSQWTSVNAYLPVSMLLCSISISGTTSMSSSHLYKIVTVGYF